jgi:hypothetical protein
MCSSSGCGGASVDAPKTPRVGASGTVTFDGQPVPAGTVTYLHPATGHLAVCLIDDGEYVSESGQGPNPGQNTVTIVGMESAEGDPLWGGAWTKQVDVGDGDVTEDFEIAKSAVKPFDPKSVQIDD